jgi:hypothetical protein
MAMRYRNASPPRRSLPRWNARRLHARMGPGIPAVRLKESQRLFYRRALEGSGNSRAHSLCIASASGRCACIRRNAMDRLPAPGRIVPIGRSRFRRRDAPLQGWPHAPGRPRPAVEDPAPNPSTRPGITSSAPFYSSSFVSKWALFLTRLSLDAAMGQQFASRPVSLAARSVGPVPISGAPERPGSAEHLHFAWRGDAPSGSGLDSLAA